MGLFALEHSKAAYRADFVLYGAAVTSLAAYLRESVPGGQAMESVVIALSGLAGWTLIEYLLHRFVLHGLRPFSRWHANHHQRPRALICAPTILSATLVVVLVFLPALLWAGLWRACAFTLGVVAGYLAYAITHHATHHWRAGSEWLKRRRRWHALHHRRTGHPGHYGVTSAFWDHVFGSARVSPAPEGGRAAARNPARAAGGAGQPQAASSAVRADSTAVSHCERSKVPASNASIRPITRA
ncbi:MAG: sterol desaturase family protein [Vicinamibacterales bacterium]